MAHRQRLARLRASGRRRFRGTTAESRSARRRQRRRSRIVLGPGRIVLGRRPKTKRSFGQRLRSTLLSSLGFGPQIKDVRAGTFALGAGRVASGVAAAARGFGQFAVRRPKTAIGLALGVPAGVGFVTTPLGQKIFSPIERFRGGRGFGLDPSGFLKGLFGGQQFRDPTDLIQRQRQARQASLAGGGFPTIPIIFGAGLGAGLLGLAAALRSRGREAGLTPPALSPAPVIGAAEAAPDKPVGAPGLERAVPNINVRVKPQINVKVSNKPQILNILQS